MQMEQRNVGSELLLIVFLRALVGDNLAIAIYVHYSSLLPAFQNFNLKCALETLLIIAHSVHMSGVGNADHLFQS